MSLSPREQRVLGTIERDLADTEPFLNRALASMRLPLQYRIPPRSVTKQPHVSYAWLALIIGGLAGGVALLWAGLVLGIPDVAIPGAALTQIAPIGIGWLARSLRRKRRRTGASDPDTGRNASAGR